MKILAKIIIILAIFWIGFWVGNHYAVIPAPGGETGFEQPDAAGQASLMLDFGDGEIKTFNSVDIPEPGTVFALLDKVTAENDIELQYQDYGGEMGVFVEAIGNRESDFDANSFWQFWVNNEYAQVGPSSYQLHNGDMVEWKYVKGQF